MNNASVALRTRWDGSLLRTLHLQPKTGFSVLIDFPLRPDAPDAGLPEPIAWALARGLTEYGIVAGRWFDQEKAAPEGVTMFPHRKRNPVQWVIERISDTWPVPVGTTRSPYVVYDLLGQGWSMQYQALLLFDPDDAASQAHAISALSTNRDWSTFDFPPPVRALIGPGVDGDFIVVATATRKWLKAVLGCLAGSFYAAGYPFSIHD